MFTEFVKLSLSYKPAKEMRIVVCQTKFSRR